MTRLLFRFFFPLAALLISVCPGSSWANEHDAGIQSELAGNIGAPYHVTTAEGSEFFGKLLETNAQTGEAVFESGDLGQVRISISRIKSVERQTVSASPAGEYWFPNPNKTRYFLSPNAIPLQKNQGYYQNTYLLFNSFNIGITDHVSLGTGFEFTSLFMNHPLYFIMPKASVQVSDTFYAGGGILYAGIDAPEMANQGFGIAYGLGTYGNADNNITLGAGYGFAGDAFMKSPIVTISLATRVSERIGLITENWLHRDLSIYSYGIRFMGKKITVDLALVNNKEISRVLPVGFPFVDFVVAF